jgi:hypothetical protein
MKMLQSQCGSHMLRVTILFFMVLLCGATTGMAWGPTGHRVTGWIAEKYVNKKTKKKLETILKGESLAMLSTWMDEVRSDSSYRHMDDWHWVTIPKGMTYEQTSKNDRGDLIMTIEQIVSELKGRKLSAADELEKLKILIHLVGDIHQPLHVGSRNDKGGNDVKILWFKKESNLHRVWDSEMIDDSKLSFTELAQSLETPSSLEILQWQKNSVRDWAKESQSYNDQIYNYGNGELGYAYTYQHFRLVRLRLLQAGVRLAGLLNEIYGQ